MATEKKNGGVKVEAAISKNLHKKFKSKARKLGVSMAERIRVLLLQDVK